jgi:glycosidase
MKRLLPGFFLLFVVQVLASDDHGVYPTHWWVGMKNPKLQLMVYRPNVGNYNKAMITQEGITVEKLTKVENRNYLFIDLRISSTAKPGTFNIKLTGGGDPIDISYQLKTRRAGNGTAFAKGVNSSDFIYMLMPDRFSNGDLANDRIPGLRDQSLNRDSIFLRHGGDISGIINHLDYLQELGVTTLWPTPVFENDMPNRTEHGYAITNHYRVDPRLGGDANYKRLSDSLHARGMKLIQDAVYNHCGFYNFFIQDMPMKDWVHQWPSYTNTTYKDQPLFDKYASAYDQKKMLDGWFTRMMPDLNQSNPFVANFLIQNAIWCVEEFGVDGWRIDTYIYNDLEFMNHCNQALVNEYPKMTMFGETWVHGTTNQAFFAENTMNTKFKSNLQGVTDFQLNLYGINPALTQNFGWTEGVNKLYQTLSNDILYKDPMRNVIFLDNHDMSRFLSQMNEDVDKLKMGIAWLLTYRGIPQMYYGTEVLMKGISNPDGWVRLDFPGGWNGDPQNKFTSQGRNEKENEVFDYTRRFANFRKASTAIKTGNTMQYLPENGVYVYFRYDNKQTVMCVMNQNTNPATIDMSRFSERIKDFTKAFDVATGVTFNLEPKLTLGGKYVLVMELRK